MTEPVKTVPLAPVATEPSVIKQEPEPVVVKPVIPPVVSPPKPVVATVVKPVVKPVVKEDKPVHSSDILEKIKAILFEHDNKETDIPISHGYWHLLNHYRRLRNQENGN